MFIYNNFSIFIFNIHINLYIITFFNHNYKYNTSA
uniref:Uncharacterized protein n=1 Tax=Chondria sp. (in: red algae) TaxID=1982705 RepID=A0A1Z1MR25_9FLOR|nr:hypothetical protein [Chondria sp. (in: red algae)]